MYKSRARDAGAIGYLAVFLALMGVVAYLNRYHTEQQTNFVTAYISMAEHYKGHLTRSVLTYPLWGYPFVLLALPRYTAVIIPQIVLGALATTAVFLRLRIDLPQYRKALLALFVLGAPWLLLHSVRWPQSFAASLIVLGLVLLDRAVRRGTSLGGVLAGLVLGMALYFRSEFLYLPVFVVGLVVLARLTRKGVSPPIRPVLACALTSFAILVPWGIHYYEQTGRFSLTASQRGIVALISLGQLPGNPWHLAYKDEYAVDYLNERGISLPAQSDSADRILFAEFKRRVREHPGAFAEKVVWNAAMTLVGGFYSGEVHLSTPEQRQLAELRSRLKSLANLEEVDGSTEGSARIDSAVVAALAYWVVAKAIGSIFVVFAMFGLSVCVVRGFSCPLLLLLGAYILYQGLLLLALATEPRYLNGLYPAMVPFFIGAMAQIGLMLIGRRRSPTKTAAPVEGTTGAGVGEGPGGYLPARQAR